jgi:hypothetical protein
MHPRQLGLPLSVLGIVFWAGWGSGRTAIALPTVSVPPTHFKCYAISEPAPSFRNGPVVVTADDQFHVNEKLQIGAAELLCTPVLKKTIVNGPQLSDKGDHLKCYSIKGKAPGRSAHIYDQFGHNVPKVDVGPGRLLCAPATKDF